MSSGQEMERVCSYNPGACMWLTYTHNHTWVSYAEKSSIKLQLLNKSANYNYMLKANHRHNYYKRKSLKFTIEGLHERTEHLDIFLYSAHHSMVIYFRCSVYWWKVSVRLQCFKIAGFFSRTKQIPLFG